MFSLRREQYSRLEMHNTLGKTKRNPGFFLGKTTTIHTNSFTIKLFGHVLAFLKLGIRLKSNIIKELTAEQKMSAHHVIGSPINVYLSKSKM